MKVIQVPRPTAGIASPEDGMVRVRGAGAWPGAAPGRAKAAPDAAAAVTDVLRVRIIRLNVGQAKGEANCALHGSRGLAARRFLSR